MKKAFLAIGLLLAVVAGVFGQTYQYQYVETINTATGVKTKYSDYSGTVYGTFSGKLFYYSDANGYKKNDFPTYDTYGFRVAFSLFNSGFNGQEKYTWVFMKEENNLLVYGSMKQDGSFDNNNYLYITKDYKRLNYRLYGYNSDSGTTVWMVRVFELYEPPKRNEGHIEFY